MRKASLPVVQDGRQKKGGYAKDRRTALYALFSASAALRATALAFNQWTWLNGITP